MNQIEYRKNKNWDIIQIDIEKYSKKEIEQKIKEYILTNKIENKILDIIETIPTNKYIYVQFALIDIKDK